MWPQVQSDLECAISGTFFPRLIYDKAYTDFLREARIRPVRGLDFSSLTAAQRANLKNVAKLRVSLFVREIQSKMAVDAGSVTFAMLKNCALYRVANSKAPGSPAGIWWFTQDIWDRCGREAGPSDSQRIVWLHKHLAVCYDWSECDRIVRIQTDSGLPVVQAVGLPKMLFDSPRMLSEPLPGIVHKATLHGGLPGGLIQTILFFIPRLEIRDVIRFSTDKVGNPYLR